MTRTEAQNEAKSLWGDTAYVEKRRGYCFVFSSPNPLNRTAGMGRSWEAAISDATKESCHA